MIRIFALALWLLQTASTYTLTVVGGTGSGSYACGAVVPISTPAKWPTFWTDSAGVKTQVPQDLVFAQWAGDYSVGTQSPQTTITMPCRNVVLFGIYSAGISPVTTVIVR